MNKTAGYLSAVLSLAVAFSFLPQTTNAITPIDLTNNEKLLLATTTPVGTVVRITDQGNVLEEYVGPSATTTVVFISGSGSSAVDGVYTMRGTFSGKPYYNLVGRSNSTHSYSIYNSGGAWTITGSSNSRYYFAQDVVDYPWLVTDWTGDVGNPPYPNVTSLTAGELEAGLTVVGAGSSDVNGTYYKRSTQDGRYSYGIVGGSFQPEGIFYNANVWEIQSSTFGYNSLDEVAVPYSITTWNSNWGDLPFPTIYRNDVASETNWITYTGSIDGEGGFGTTIYTTGGLASVINKSLNDAWWNEYATRVGIITTPTSTASEVISTSTATSSTSSSTLATNPKFLKDLRFGMIDTEVRSLQEYLNSAGFNLATSGAGSMGNESDYFGTRTLQALIKYQIKNYISPAIGFFGPITRASINNNI